jgi:membrane fusion protein (multidrug efflux system)
LEDGTFLMSADGKSESGPDFGEPILPPQPLAQRLRLPLMVGAPVIVVGAAVIFYLAGGRYETTDDAYVQAGKVQVSSNIPGRVISVDVTENQLVKAGQPLFHIDPAPLDAAYAQSEAQAAQTRLQVATLKAAYEERQADTRAATDLEAYQKHELARQKTLLAAGVASQSAVDQAQNTYDAAVQKLAAAKEAEASALAALGGSPDAPVANHPMVKAADAAVERDRLNRSYTVVYASQDGIATKVDQLQPGNYVGAAQPLFSLVSPRVWIEGDFKEDQLAHVKPGQSVTVEVDARKGVTYHGKVASLSPGTGSSFALLPAENATGNWVKVVQRLPIRIELDEKELAKAPLAAGLSAKVTIDTGHKRSLFGEARAEQSARP